jgi:hydroxymethylbilane synthase
MSPQVLKLGTRRSMLARTQSQWVANQIEKLNPGVSISLVGIETQGDRIQDIPLSKIEGKDFFVAELDQALIRGDVDLTVHSMKDLSLVRPKEITLAATPKRENPRDIVFFSPHVLEKIKDRSLLRIGTSAPRRLDSLPEFFNSALPYLGGEPSRFKFVEVRGNVNSRLERIHLPENDPKKLDAVVLALAGVERLLDAHDQEILTTVQRLIAPSLWMILPLDLIPTAPAQGALAVECRSSDERTLKLISKLHDPNTLNSVVEERKILQDWGGGCHQRLGATQIYHPRLGNLLIIKGTHPNSEKVQTLKWKSPECVETVRSLWDGTKYKGKANELKFDSKWNESISNSKNLYVTHVRALHKDIVLPSPDKIRTWVSGTASWYKLAKKGVWVNGSSEGLGIEFWMDSLVRLKIISAQTEKWSILTHTDALETWHNVSHLKLPTVISTYRIENASPDHATPPEKQMILQLERATHLYWSSGSQYESLKKYAKKAVHHACGPGKTARHSHLIAFPNVEAWRKWLKSNTED